MFVNNRNSLGDSLLSYQLEDGNFLQFKVKGELTGSETGMYKLVQMSQINLLFYGALTHIV